MPAQSSPPPDARRAWAVAALLCVLMAVNFADKSVLGLSADDLTEELGLTARQFGLAGSIFFLLFGITGVVVGFLGNRVTSTRLLLTVALAWSAAMGPLLLYPTFVTLLISRLLLGAAEGPTSPAAGHAIHKWFPESRRAVPTSLIFVGASAGVAISAPVLTYLIEHHGWASAYWALALLGIAWSAAWLLVGRDGPYTTYAAASDLSPAASTDPAERRTPYRKLFAASGWWGPLLALAPGYFAMALFSVWGPSYLGAVLGYSKQSVGLLIGFYGLVAGAAQIGLSWLSGRLIRSGMSTRWARGAYTGGTVALSGILLIASMAAHRSEASAWLMLVAFGLANSMYTIGYLLVSETSPVRQRSAMLASFNSAMTAGAVLAPFLGGLLVQQAPTETEGFRAAFLLAGLLLLVGGLAAAWFTDPVRDARRLGLRNAEAPMPTSTSVPSPS
ncbi:MFS transporter [Streptomyces sp. NBC_00344]|uniref:MFS transporter n=1 Tax=Streptomyces sp. NBC_00344 TaxID=2975720 RepID=UPI002E21B847